MNHLTELQIALLDAADAIHRTRLLLPSEHPMISHLVGMSQTIRSLLDEQEGQQ